VKISSQRSDTTEGTDGGVGLFCFLKAPREEEERHISRNWLSRIGRRLSYPVMNSTFNQTTNKLRVGDLLFESDIWTSSSGCQSDQLLYMAAVFDCSRRAAWLVQPSSSPTVASLSLILLMYAALDSVYHYQSTHHRRDCNRLT
jgi:hypothetical protein